MSEHLNKEFVTNADSLKAMAEVLTRCSESSAAFYFERLAEYVASRGHFPKTEEEIADALGV